MRQRQVNHQGSTRQPSVNHQGSTSQPSVNHQGSTSQPSVNYETPNNGEPGTAGWHICHRNDSSYTRQRQVNHKGSTRQPSVNHQGSTRQPSVNHQGSTRQPSVNYETPNNGEPGMAGRGPPTIVYTIFHRYYNAYISYYEFLSLVALMDSSIGVFFV